MKNDSIFNEPNAPARPKRSKFDLSHFVKLTGNMGNLIPIWTDEMLPGDDFKWNTQIFLRFFALIAPVMHRVDVYHHCFFVPNRLLWANWQDFITAGQSGTDGPSVPVLSYGGINAVNASLIKPSSLLDYLGLPAMPGAGVYNVGYNGFGVSALPFGAYQLIYQEYFRDQDIETGLSFPAAGLLDASNDANALTLTALRVRNWEKDYFTTARPTAQRGSPVQLPSAVGGIGFPVTVRKVSDGSAQPSQTALDSAAGSGIMQSLPAGVNVYLDAAGSSFTVAALRLAEKLQSFLERGMRGGSRYIEFILGHFGVLSSDARLQRPEYIGGGKAPVVISEVLSTSTGTGTGQTPLATLGGHGVSVQNSGWFRYKAEEHGIIMCIMSVLPRTAYQQGMPRMFQRLVQTDYAFPEFANLGEQSVISKEVYYDVSDAAGVSLYQNVFGYQSRYADYKYRAGRTCGQFRTTLSFWTLTRIFASTPVLNSSFVISNPSNGIFAVATDVDHMACEIEHSISALRPLPYHGTPYLWVSS